MLFQQPSKIKFKKQHKGKLSMQQYNTNKLDLKNGVCGLKALEAGRLTAKHIEVLRRALKRIVRKAGKFWINVYPHFPVSSKPNENRMGKGKGVTKYFTSRVIAGQMITEIQISNLKLGTKALISASKKLPLLSTIIKR